MKRSLLICLFPILLLCICHCTATARSSVVDNPDNRLHWGLRLSLDGSYPGKIHAAGNRLPILKNGGGAAAGVVCNIPIVANLYLEPGVNLFYEVTESDIEAIEELAPDKKVTALSFRKFGASMPIVIGYHFDFEYFKLYFFTGVDLRLGIIERQRLSTEIDGIHRTKWSNLYTERGLHRFDCAYRLGLGLQYSRWSLSAAYNIGMRNMVRNAPNGYSWRENLLQISLGYNF